MPYIKCNNCLKADECEANKRIEFCEDYYPLGELDLAEQEYNEDLKERVNYYQRFLIEEGWED